MNQDSAQAWSYVAWTIAWITAITSAILIYAFGETETIRGGLMYGPYRESVVNWPLIVGLIASTIYAFLFAAVMSALHRNISLGEQVLDELRAMRAGEEVVEKSVVGRKKTVPEAAEDAMPR